MHRTAALVAGKRQPTRLLSRCGESRKWRSHTECAAVRRMALRHKAAGLRLTAQMHDSYCQNRPAPRRSPSGGMVAAHPNGREIVVALYEQNRTHSRSPIVRPSAASCFSRNGRRKKVKAVPSRKARAVLCPIPRLRLRSQGTSTVYLVRIPIPALAVTIGHLRVAAATG